MSPWLKQRDKGILHVALTMPTGAGEAYDATTRLMQTLLAKIAADVVVSNSERARAGLPPQPLLHTVWTMRKWSSPSPSPIGARTDLRRCADIMKRDSRIMSRLETRRGFVPLEDCEATPTNPRILSDMLTCSWSPRSVLLKFPEVGIENFPPHRPTYLPPECASGSSGFDFWLVPY